MNKKAVLVGCGVVMAALTACSSGGEADSSAAPSPAVSSASVTQIASALTPSINSATEAVGKYDDAFSEFVFSSVLDEGTVKQDKALCSATMLAANYTAQTLSLTVEGLVTPTSNTYIGQPPAELVPLLDETKQEADAFVASAEEQSAKKKCRVEPLTVTSFSNVLEKWGPYL